MQKTISHICARLRRLYVIRYHGRSAESLGCSTFSHKRTNPLEASGAEQGCHREMQTAASRCEDASIQGVMDHAVVCWLLNFSQSHHRYQYESQSHTEVRNILSRILDSDLCVWHRAWHLLVSWVRLLRRDKMSKPYHGQLQLRSD